MKRLLQVDNGFFCFASFIIVSMQPAFKDSCRFLSLEQCCRVPRPLNQNFRVLIFELSEAVGKLVVGMLKSLKVPLVLLNSGSQLGNGYR